MARRSLRSGTAFTTLLRYGWSLRRHYNGARIEGEYHGDTITLTALTLHASRTLSPRFAGDAPGDNGIIRHHQRHAHHMSFFVVMRMSSAEEYVRHGIVAATTVQHIARNCYVNLKWSLVWLCYDDILYYRY